MEADLVVRAARAVLPDGERACEVGVRGGRIVAVAPAGAGLPGREVVDLAADRPYGLIEATVLRDDASDAGSAWHAVPGWV